LEITLRKHEQLALEGLLVLDALASADEDLDMPGLRGRDFRRLRQR
jgi:hypothetical protein